MISCYKFTLWPGLAVGIAARSDEASMCVSPLLCCGVMCAPLVLVCWCANGNRVAGSCHERAALFEFVWSCECLVWCVNDGVLWLEQLWIAVCVCHIVVWNDLRHSCGHSKAKRPQLLMNVL